MRLLGWTMRGKRQPERVAAALACYARLLTVLRRPASARRDTAARALTSRICRQLAGLGEADSQAYYDGVQAALPQPEASRGDA